jgi:hypothetical protein
MPARRVLRPDAVAIYVTVCPPTWTGEKTTSSKAASATRLHTDSDTTIAILQSTRRKMEAEILSGDNTTLVNIMGLPAKSSRG